MPSTIGNNIKKARINAGLTQQALADFAKVNRVTIARYECGSRKPSIQNLMILSGVLNCTLDDFHQKTELKGELNE